MTIKAVAGRAAIAVAFCLLTWWLVQEAPSEPSRSVGSGPVEAETPSLLEEAGGDRKLLVDGEGAGPSDRSSEIVAQEGAQQDDWSERSLEQHIRASLLMLQEMNFSPSVQGVLVTSDDWTVDALLDSREFNPDQKVLDSPREAALALLLDRHNAMIEPLEKDAARLLDERLEEAVDRGNFYSFQALTPRGTADMAAVENGIKQFEERFGKQGFESWRRQMTGRFPGELVLIYTTRAEAPRAFGLLETVRQRREDRSRAAREFLSGL